MPRYNKKITRVMGFAEFKGSIQDLPDMHQAFLTLLFLAGCRVSEALALTSHDISYTDERVYVQFYRLKGSKQTDPQEFPRISLLEHICAKQGRPFPFSRTTAYRVVKRAFPELYPHYFRMNRITKVDLLFGDATVYSVFGISATSIDHYRGKVDIKRVGDALQKEVS